MTLTVLNVLIVYLYFSSFTVEKVTFEVLMPFIYLVLPEDGSRLQLQHVTEFSYTEWNPVITTSVYTTSRLWSQMFCGTISFDTVYKNVTLLGYKDTKLC